MGTSHHAPLHLKYAVGTFLSNFAVAQCLAQSVSAPAIELSTPPPVVPGFTTYVVDIVPTLGTTVTTIEGVFSSNIVGTMRQVNPFGLPTVLNSNNGLFAGVGEDPLADSQFHFGSGDATLIINATESSSSLTAAFAGLLPPRSARFTLAHVVLADGATGTWEISVVQNEGTGIGTEYHLSGVFGPAVSQVPGDYNGSGTVDAADYVLWRETLGLSGSGLAADGNGNQLIDAGDYDLWRASFGQAAGSGAVGVAVPEPTTCGLLLIAIIGIGGRRRSVVATRTLDDPDERIRARYKAAGPVAPEGLG